MFCRLLQLWAPQNEIKKQDKLVKKEQKLLELTGEMGLKEVEVV